MRGELSDQSELYGLLDRIQSLGLELIEVRRWAASQTSKINARKGVQTMSTEPRYESRSDPDGVSGWAAGGSSSPPVMVFIGVFQVIAGLVAIFDDGFYVVTQNYTFDSTQPMGLDPPVARHPLAPLGFSLFARRTWAAVTAIMLADFTAIENFFFIPYYPFWAILVIALGIWVIWALTRPGVVRD